MARIIDTDSSDGNRIIDTRGANVGIDDNGFVDPVTASSGSGGSGTSGVDRSAGDPPRRRGRKPGSGRSQKAIPGAALTNLETILYNASGLLAGICERKDFQLDNAEAKALADAANNVARHYTWLSGVSERGQDWFNLFMITGVIVGARWHNPVPSKTPAQSGTVVQFPQKTTAVASQPAVTTVSAVAPSTTNQPPTPPTNAVNLTLGDLYSVEIPPHDGPLQ